MGKKLLLPCQILLLQIAFEQSETSIGLRSTNGEAKAKARWGTSPKAGPDPRTALQSDIQQVCYENSYHQPHKIHKQVLKSGPLHQTFSTFVQIASNLSSCIVSDVILWRSGFTWQPQGLIHSVLAHHVSQQILTSKFCPHTGGCKCKE